MKFTNAILAAALAGLMAPFVAGVPATTDIYYHEKPAAIGPSMWTFSSAGLQIHSADGSKLIKSHSGPSLECPIGQGCFFFDVVTDGHKYVWATSLHTSPNRVDVFSIESGEYVGAVKSCSTPLGLDYLPNREEVWVRCAGPDGGNPDSAHQTVISTSSLAAATEEVFLKDGRAYGRSVFHDTLGNYGYSTVHNDNVVYKVDLAARVPVSNFTVDEKAQASYDMTYSPENKHVYVRSRVCCSCGFDGADLGTCPSSVQKIDILVGPSAGQNVDGTCGGGCEGSTADVLGVIEYDTVGGSVVAKHNIKEGTGFGATPQSSPDGKHIVLFGNDGGKNLRVLEAQGNGQPSTVAFDIPLDFSNVPPGREAVRDFAFVQWKNHDIIALSTAFDNNLALIDLSMTPPKHVNLKLSNAAETTGSGRGSGRMIEWVYGTDYLWVDGAGANELYVVRLSADGDISKAVVERTIPEVSSSLMLYVEDYADRKNEMMMTELIKSVTADGAVVASSDETPEAVDEDKIVSEVKSQLQKEGYLREEDDDEDEKANAIAIAALAIGLVSLLLNIVLLLHITMAKKDTAGPESAPARDDIVTLGSKRVA